MPIVPRRLSGEYWKRTRSEAWASSSDACSTPASPTSPAALPPSSADLRAGFSLAGALAAKLGDRGLGRAAFEQRSPEASGASGASTSLLDGPSSADACKERRRRGRRRRASKRRAIVAERLQDDGPPVAAGCELNSASAGEQPLPGNEVLPQLPITGRCGAASRRGVEHDSAEGVEAGVAPSTSCQGRRRTVERSTTWAPGDVPAEQPPIFDIVADADGNPVLLPVDSPWEEGAESPTTPVKDLPEEEVVTTRVFRFFEDHEDHEQQWEQQLRNVNTGSILWLLVHLLPKMHTRDGAKYGKWFTVHAVRARASSFWSGCYHAADEGRSHAKTFGATPAVSTLVTGKRLPTGYFWYVHPAARQESKAQDVEFADVHDEEHLDRCGWQHVERAGPIHGDAFLEEWRRQGSPMDERSLQTVLDQVLAKVESSLAATSPKN